MVFSSSDHVMSPLLLVMFAVWVIRPVFPELFEVGPNINSSSPVQRGSYCFQYCPFVPEFVCLFVCLSTR